MSTTYPDNWDQIRRVVYQRDDYTCQRCGEKNTELHAHHIKPKSQGGSHNLSNLTTLCKSCHESVHGHPVGGRVEREKSTTIWWLGIITGFFMLFIPPLMPIGALMLFGGIMGLILE